MNNEMKTLALGALLSLVAVGCGLDESAKTSCEAQSDCLGGYLCVSETCLAAPSGATGEPLSATGSWSTAIVLANAGALQLALGNEADVCSSRYSRVDFLRAPGLRIDVVAAGRAGSLERVPPADTSVSGYIGNFVGSPVEARNQFAAVLRYEGSEGEILEAAVTDGSVTLDARPDYDSGALVGQYQLVANGKLFSGAFNATYCPTEEGVNAAEIGNRIYYDCSMNADLALESGSCWGGEDCGDVDTTERDLTRMAAAWGLSAETAACLYEQIDRCKSGQVVDETQHECLHDDMSRCLNPYQPFRAECGQ